MGRTGGFESGEPLLTGAPTGTELLGALTTGNIGVYRDIYWQHLAYERGGLAELERVFRSGEMGTVGMEFPERALEAWRTIDRGRQAVREGRAAKNQDQVSRGNDLIWKGNQALLHHEQAVTLQQGVYEHHREAFRWLSSGWNIEGIRSPIPGDTSEFREAVPGGDIGRFEDRWRWISEQMLPAWRRLAETDPDRVRRDMEEFAARGG